MLLKAPFTLVLLIPAALLLPDTCHAADKRRQTYHEALYIAPLPDGKVHSDFLFTIRGEPWREEPYDIGSNAKAQHYTLLPPELTNIVQRLQIGSFHLTLSSGRWSSTWQTDSHSSATKYLSNPASGIELHAWLKKKKGESEVEERRRWEEFTGKLGGLFCVGIKNAGTASVSSPTWGYRPLGEISAKEYSLYRLLLPRLSATCTETLTPFIGQLPCSSQAGLSGLLNPHKLFDGDWTLLSVQYFSDGYNGVFELEVGSVLDPVRISRLNGGLGSRDFAIENLYGRKLARACPLATSSMIYLSIPSNSPHPFKIFPETFRERRLTDHSAINSVAMADNGQDTRSLSASKLYATWDCKEILSRQRSAEERLDKETSLNVGMEFIGEFPFRYPLITSLPVAPLVARRILEGYGQERGKLGVGLTNNLNDAVDVIWVESWPWWVRGFVGSLDMTSEPHEGLKSTDHLHHKCEGAEKEGAILNISYVPPIARQRPTTLQALLRIPPLTTIRVLLDYESSYLWYTEYPSDAHRGFEVPGASLILLSPTSAHRAVIPDPKQCQEGGIRGLVGDGGEEIFRTHTGSILLSLPTPDFSMPYNVIILTSTIIALFFGSVMNGLVRTWYVVDLAVKDTHATRKTN